MRIFSSANSLRSSLASCLLLAAGAALGQQGSPFARLVVQGAEQPVTIGSLDVRVVIHGLHAVTTQTLVFNNPNGRVLEGDLEFPLPDGAAVSGFALDVDGQLVDGVVVSKEKARVVLETEVRRGVDPGLAEQVRGNLYRARIYPIPARGTRTVRLRWVSELTTRGSEAAYLLPLPYGAPIGHVALRVEVVRKGPAPQIDGGFGNLALRRWEDRWVAEAQLQGAQPTRDLLVKLPRLADNFVDLESGAGETFFAASALLPAGASEQVAPPARIALAWDASGSRDSEATDRERRFLSALLRKWPDTAVDLVVFRDRVEKPLYFAGGDGRALLTRALREAPNDGGTALGALDLRRAALPHPSDALWILASDGLATLGESLPLHGDVPVFALTGATVADRGLLRHVSAATGGQLLDLVALDTAAAVRAMTRSGVRLLQVNASPPSAVADVQTSAQADRGRVAISGRLLAEEAELTLVFGAPGHVVEERVVKLSRALATATSAGETPIATAWAQAQAEVLGLFADRNADALLSLGRRFGLVTANTSLLVLETLAQHLEHGVEPAASRTALREQFLAQMGARDKVRAQERQSHLEQVVQLWQARLQWWNTEFRLPPGYRHSAPPKEDAPGSLGSVGSGAASAPSHRGMGSFGRARTRDSAQGVAESAAKKSKESGAESAEASIAIKPWDPQVPYLAALKAAPEGRAYEAYLGLRAQHQGPAFYLDCAELFLRAGDKELGLRILSNLAELRLDEPALLRVLAWRLSQAGELDLAAGVLEKVLRLRPEEPQSRRDLALVLADRAEAQDRPLDAERALGLLYEVVQRGWDRFPEIELIALTEANRLIARAGRRGWGTSIHAERVDARLQKLLDLDVRVSLSWDADQTDVDLHVFEPTGEEASFRNQRTALGGLVSHDLTQGYGPEEYLVRRALPGQYSIKVHYYGSRQQTLVGPATMVATVYTNYGRVDEKRQILTLRLDSPKDMEEVGVVTIGGGK